MSACPSGRWNERLYRVVLQRKILSLSLRLSVVKFRLQWARLVSRNCPQSVCNRRQAVSVLSRLLTTTPPIPPVFLMFLSSLLLSCLESFPNQQVIPKIKALLIVAAYTQTQLAYTSTKMLCFAYVHGANNVATDGSTSGFEGLPTHNTHTMYIPKYKSPHIRSVLFV